jgi:glucose/arabinose dehydrogenase
MLARLLVLVVLVGAAVVPAASATAPGLVDTTLAQPASNPLSSPTAIAPILATGRALVLEKGGTVRVLEADGTLSAADALTLSVCTDSEEGLLGAAVDPGFATNGYIYLYYTHKAGDCASSTGRFNRVSRFTMVGDTIAPASEQVLLDNLNIPAGNHDGGDLHIGNDGDLYVTVGDGGTNPRGGGGSAGQDLSLLNGKILRITTAGGVPADNPFVGALNAMSCATAGVAAPTTARCTEIYAYGLRNPFRFAFDPNTTATRFFINDVGENTWEEVDAGGNGLNYGWSVREGFCANGSTTNCGPTPAGFTDPLTVYNHSSGCTYITAGAFIPNGLWAPAYDGGYLFADGGCGKVFLRTAAGTVDYGDPFALTSGTITDMAFLTQGGRTALYYVTNGTGRLHAITLPLAPPLPPMPGGGGAAPAPGAPTPPATGLPAPPATTAAVRCRIAAVRGLLATTARAAIAAAHCTAHQVTVAMRASGRPLTRHGKLVRAGSSARPKRSPGHRRAWTLRVERVTQQPGSVHAAGARETIWVGWEATPTALAHKRAAHYL